MRFEYLEPTSLEEAITLLSRHGSRAKVLAGGTDLLPSLKERVLRPGYVINIKRIPGLDSISYAPDQGARIGALATIRSLETSPVVKEKYQALAEAARVLGSPQIRNLATVGGNLCHAAPSAETASPLLVLSASVRLAGAHTERVIPLESFFTGPGATILEDGELLVELLLPEPPPQTGTAYVKHSPRSFMDIAVAGVAVMVALEKGRVAGCRIALGAVAPTPMIAHEAESLLRGQRPTKGLLELVARKAAAEARPVSDIRASAEYRRDMVRVQTARALRLALARAGQSGMESRS